MPEPLSAEERDFDALHEAAHAVTAERLAPGCSLDIFLDVFQTGVPAYGYPAETAMAVFMSDLRYLPNGEDRAVSLRASRFVDPRSTTAFVADDISFAICAEPHRRGTLAAKAKRLVAQNRGLIEEVAREALVSGSHLTGDEIRCCIRWHDVAGPVDLEAER